MSKIFFAVAGTKNYFGSVFFKPGMLMRLLKEPDNEYDKEAIRVELKGLGKIGYVANSIYTVIGECSSAGRMPNIVEIVFDRKEVVAINELGHLEQ